MIQRMDLGHFGPGSEATRSGLDYVRAVLVGQRPDLDHFGPVRLGL